MLLVVNNSIDGQGDSARELRAALERVTTEIVLLESYWDVTPARIERIAPSHIFLSGQADPWTRYEAAKLAGIFAVIRTVPKPILGICGGHQQIAVAHGAPVDVMKRIAPGDGYEGCVKERGFLPIQHHGARLFLGLPESITVWHSHFDEVKLVPTGFVSTAANSSSAIQAMEHESLPIFGVQFHPELFDEVHEAGLQILRNFLAV